MPIGVATDLSPTPKLDFSPGDQAAHLCRLIFYCPSSEVVVMSRAVLVALMALFALSVTPVSSVHADDDGDTVVWGN